MLFDQIILAKKNRGRQSLFGKSKTPFLSDTSDHLWRSAVASPPNGRFLGDYRQIVSRSKYPLSVVYHLLMTVVAPAKLDPSLMKEPRVIQGVPRINNAKARRKPIPSMLGANGMLATSPPS